MWFCVPGEPIAATRPSDFFEFGHDAWPLSFVQGNGTSLLQCSSMMNEDNAGRARAASQSAPCHFCLTRILPFTFFANRRQANCHPPALV